VQIISRVASYKNTIKMKLINILLYFYLSNVTSFEILFSFGRFFMQNSTQTLILLVILYALLVHLFCGKYNKVNLAGIGDFVGMNS
jgi:hypothetical protein